jgi:hypothetical protein
VRRPAAIAALVLAATLASGSARADDGGDEGPDPDEPSAGLRVPGAITWLVPGVLLHGSGHFTIGRRTTAYRLLAMEGIGVGMVVIAGIPIALTAASRYLIREAAVVGAMGVGLFAISLQADLYGTVVPLDSRGEPSPTLPHVEAEIGYRYVYNPRFAYSSFVVNALELRHGGLLLAPSTWVALDDANRRTRVLGGYRFFGPRAEDEPAKDGSFIELTAGVTHHAHHTERFATLTPEVMTNGRLDLARIDPHLAGSFGELGIGFALQLFDYEGLPLGEDIESLLLARMGFGFYLGGPRAPHGEFTSYYDHRHDDFVAGFTERSIGVPGHVGFAGEGYFTDHFGVSAIFEAGAAIMAGGSILLREAPP